MYPCLRAIAASLLCLCPAAFGADGLVAVQSPYSAKDTMNRFEDIAKQRGMNVFARIDHAAGAAKVGKVLRPTEVLIFGNPQGGTPLMECAQSVGIDLPLKALVWEDAAGQVWLGTTTWCCWRIATASQPARGWATSARRWQAWPRRAWRADAGPAVRAARRARFRPARALRLCARHAPA